MSDEPAIPHYFGCLYPGCTGPGMLLVLREIL